LRQQEGRLVCANRKAGWFAPTGRGDPVRVSIRTVAAVAVTALLAAGCSRAGSSSTQATNPASSSAPASSSSSGSASAAGSFGSLTGVCHGGSATGSTGQGVTSSQILAGVLTDVGYTKDPQLETTAKVFTSWCNAAGGINGRKLVADIHDTQMLNVVGAMSKACASDFVLAGGSAALDGLAVTTRLKCLLPDYDAQVVMPQNEDSGLQIYPIPWSHTYSVYSGYYSWLIKQAYPDSAKAVGIISGASVITQIDDSLVVQTVKAVGGNVIYNESFPPAGVTDWTPYAEAIKNKGVKGLTFYGITQQLPALEQALDNIGYKLDWIDANTNSYGTNFISLAGKSLSTQHNYADLPAVYPLEKAAGNPATEQLVKLFGQYAPGQPVTLQDVQAWSAWLIFASSAESCGSNLTRKCVYDAALKQTYWTGGGLTAPVNVAKPDSPPSCFDVEQATPSGWQPAPFDPNNGAYRCGQPVVKLQGIPPAAQLSAVGLSLSNLK
jgi:ABC-type branched-subunit amino acid transport system substrate-binding protein